MSAYFNEGLIERCYFTLWEQHFADVYGSREFETYVPGAEEVHVGFDLGFATFFRNYYSNRNFFNWLKERIAETSRGDSAFILAYFYQYKLIKRTKRLSMLRNREAREGLSDLGYAEKGELFRARLDTVRNTYAGSTKRRPFSQHDALCRLARINGTNVYYCTPRFLEVDGIPKLHLRKLSDLNTTQVTHKTPTFRDRKAHHLCFQSVLGSNSAWCSEPIPTQTNDEMRIPELLTPRQLLQLIKANYLSAEGEEISSFRDIEVFPEDLEEKTFLLYIDALPRCTRFVVFYDT